MVPIIILGTIFESNRRLWLAIPSLSVIHPGEFGAATGRSVMLDVLGRMRATVTYAAVLSLFGGSLSLYPWI
jgi:hypothetical protein